MDKNSSNKIQKELFTSEIVKNTAKMVKKKLLGEGTGHDWWHIYRVWKLAKTIAKGEKVNTEVVELGALLHDIADYKLYDGDEEIGGEITREWLEGLGADNELIDSVVDIVDNISFKGGSEGNKIKTLEGMIVQDADRLDAIDAIGITRCFAYGGSKGREIHNPTEKPKFGMTKEEYKKHNGTSINHFYEKLLLLKGLMNTETGKQIAEGRHDYMKEFLDEFLLEWEGKR